tara:strand:+ start:2050 stop:2334 length:285 start_codon:yes stop_codon:yes gene_type:complete
MSNKKILDISKTRDQSDQMERKLQLVKDKLFSMPIDKQIEVTVVILLSLAIEQIAGDQLSINEISFQEKIDAIDLVYFWISETYEMMHDDIKIH